MLKKALSFVLASLNASTYRPRAKSLSLGRLGDGRVIRVRLGISLAAAALKAFLNILHSHCCFDQRSTTAPLEIAPQGFFYSQLASETPVRRRNHVGSGFD
jgi:hypothetical protein